METNETKTPLVDQSYQLDKFPGKGGWVYVSIPQISSNRHTFFSWVKVNGFIDGYEIANFHLMPLPDGTLFFPVKAEICKKIGKKEGDWVHVIFYPDISPAQIPEELLKCLKENPAAYLAFRSLTESLQQGLIDWIYCAKNEASMYERIDKTVSRLIE